MSNNTQAMLASLIFHWGEEGGKDKQRTKQLCDEAGGAEEEMVYAGKKFICKEARAPLKKRAAAIRDAIIEITLPWPIKNVYVCRPMKVEAMFAIRDAGFADLAHLKEHHLLGRLDEWKELTKLKAKGAYREEEFPTRDQLDADARWDLSIMPLSTSEALQHINGIAPEILEQVRANNNELIQRGVREGMHAAYTRLMDPLSNMVNVFGTPGKKIFETLVENVRRVINQIDGLNLAEDPELTRFANETSTFLNTLDLASIRDDDIIRQATADQCKSILETFGATGIRKFSL